MKVVIKNDDGEYLGLDKNGNALITRHKVFATVVDTDTEEGRTVSFEALKQGAKLETVPD